MEGAGCTGLPRMGGITAREGHAHDVWGWPKGLTIVRAALV
jgi:hypothetical protein